MDRFKLITDHKPLVPLINIKDLDTVPIRCQRLLLRLMRFNSTAEYELNNTLVVADTLYQSPAVSTIEADVSCYVNSIITLAASRWKLDEIRRASLSDSELQAVVNLVRNGWPDHSSHLHPSARDYYHYRGELSTYKLCNYIRFSCRE